MQFDFNKLPRKKPEPLQKNYICEYVQTKSLRLCPPIYNFANKIITFINFALRLLLKKQYKNILL